MTENETLDPSESEVQRSTSKRSGGALIGRFLRRWSLRSPRNFCRYSVLGDRYARVE